jgi:hypothetical protein
MGRLQTRDYACLDLALVNLGDDVRKRASQYFASVVTTLKSFIKAHSKIDEGEYRSNPTVYSQILQEKKWFLKLQIRAR